MLVEVRYKARRPGCRGPRGMSTPSCQRLSIQISRTYMVRFIPALIFCIMFIINASCVIGLGLEVEAFREMMGNSSLGYRVRVGQMCRDRESGISVILLMVDLRVVGILGVDIILDMDEFNSHQVVSN